MKWTLDPPVHSPVSGRAILNGVAVTLGLAPPRESELSAALCERYGAREALLTDSGTSALIVALRKILPRGGTIAYPAYACIDLTAAAVGAGVRVRLYDLDPMTLSPDLDSLRSTLRRGVDAIVVAHFYGYPADVVSVQSLAGEHGVPVIEDAAQGAGGTLHGVTLGSLADVAILSFGRGKGITGGAGGAVLARTSIMADWLRETRPHLRAGSRGGSAVARLAAQALLTHPGLYRIPASIPALKLGEMVYHAPQQPRGMPAASVAVLRSMLSIQDGEISNRRARAAQLHSRLRATPGVTLVRPIAGGQPGFLRLALLDSHGRIQPRANLGAVRGYPMTLDQHVELRALLLPGERAGTGSQFLRNRLFTVPTHHRVSASHLASVAEWLGEERLEPQGIPALP